MKFLVILSLMMTSLFSASAFAKKDCKANYTADSKSYTGWINVGQVGGLNKKSECKSKSLSAGPAQVKAKLASSLPAVTDAYCKNGIKIYADTEVEGKKNSKDGSFQFKPSCTYGNGTKCLKYNQKFVSGSW